MANKPNLRHRILAILQILKENTDPDIHLNSLQIKKLLSEQYGIESDRRTIREDIKILSHFGYVEDTPASIERDERGSYYIAHPFEAWQLKMLIDGIAQTDYFRPATLNSIIDKVINLSGPSDRELLAENRPILDDDIDDSDFYLSLNLDILIRAIKEKKMVSFRYFRLDADKKPQPEAPLHQVHPYIITKRGFFYYLVTFKEGDDFLRPFRIDRIRDAVVEDKPRIPAERLPIGDRTEEIQGYRKNNTDSFTGQRIAITIRWNDKPSILYDIFGLANVFVIDKEACTFSIKTMENQGLYNNLLRLGKNAEILAPSPIRENFAATIRAMAKQYL